MAPFALLVVGVCHGLRRFFEFSFVVVPFRFGTLIAYALRDIRNDPEKGQSKSRKRVIRLAAFDTPIGNHEVFRWLGGLASWIRVPRTLMLVINQICQRVPSLTYLMAKSPTNAEIIALVTSTRPIPIPEHARDLAASIEKSVETFKSKMVLGLIAREHGDLLSKMSYRSDLRPAAIHHADGNHYRDVSISHYRTMLEAVQPLGVSVIRVGNYLETSLEDAPSNYWEYAMSEFNSHLGDIAVASLVDAVISSSNGLDLLYHVIGKPTIGVNVPWVDSNYRWMHLVLPKHPVVRLISGPQELPLIALAGPDCDWSRFRPTWRGHIIDFEENSPAEIEEAVLLALSTLGSIEAKQHEVEQCRPLWMEFWKEAENGTMRIDQKQDQPTILLPTSARRRFLG